VTIFLNPLLEALEVARKAGAGAVLPDDVTVEDRGSEWFFEFIPNRDQLGGGASVTVNKNDLRVVRVVRGE
jgi:hypothetical protein